LYGGRFEHNLATLDGAAVQFRGTARFDLQHCNFSFNLAIGSGGAIAVAGKSQSTFQHLSVKRNEASEGAGFFCSQDASPHVADSFFKYHHCSQVTSW